MARSTISSRTTLAPSQNLFTRSTELVSGTWTSLEATVTHAPTVTDPFGGTQTFKVAETSATQLHIVYPNTSYTISKGQKYTVSFYAKEGTTPLVANYHTDGSGYAFTVFNVRTGKVERTSNISNYVVDYLPRIEYHGNGWWRCTVTFSLNTTVAMNVATCACTDGWNIAYAGNAANYFYTAAHQLVDGPGPGPFVTTGASATNTQVPRGKFTQMNLFKGSEALSQSWTTNVINVLNDPTGVSPPRPIPNARVYALTAVSGSTSYGVFQTPQFAGPGIYTLSGYFKKGSLSNSWVTFLPNSSTAYRWFDLVNGAMGTQTNLFSSSMQHVGDGWYRCSVTYEKTAATIEYLYVGTGNGSNGFTGDSTTVGCYLAGMQVEKGFAPGDFVSTVSGSVQGGVPSRFNVGAQQRASFVQQLNPSAYYRADQGVTLSGGRVAWWSDLSGRNMHLSQSTTTLRPWLTTADSQANNQPGVRFALTGVTGNYLTSLVPPQVSKLVSMFAVVRAESTTPSAAAWAWTGVYGGVTNASNNQGYDFRVISGSGGGDRGFGFPGLLSDAGNKVTTSTECWVLTSDASTTSSLFVNEVLDTQVSNAAVAPGNDALLVLGGTSTGVNFPIDGTIYEFALFERSLTATERAQLYQYAKRRYGL